MPTHWIIIIASTGASGAVAAVLRTWIVQSFRTRRFTTALEGSQPAQRPSIILACSRLEGEGDEKPDDNDPHLPGPQTP